MRAVTADDRAIGERIKSIRKERKISMKILADGVRVSIQQMQKYENGLNRISAGNLLTISRILKVSVASLLEYDGKADPACLLSPQAMEVALAFDGLADPAVKQALRGLILSMAATGTMQTRDAAAKTSTCSGVPFL